MSPDPVPGEGWLEKVWETMDVPPDIPGSPWTVGAAFRAMFEAGYRAAEAGADRAERERMGADLGACLAVMRAAVEVYERGESKVQDRMACLLLAMLNALGPVDSAYPPRVERAVLRFGLKGNEGQRA